MIRIALTFLRNYLENLPIGSAENPKLFDGVDIKNNYLPSKSSNPFNEGNKIYITLLNIEEERTAKTPYRYEKDNVKPNQFKLLNPILTLNLYIMISGTGDYIEALKNISKVINAFANKNAFETAEIDAELREEDKGKITELWLDIQNISLDQSNNLWQALANNILPHIIYKVRTVAIVPDKPTNEPVPEVRELGVEVLHK